MNKLAAAGALLVLLLPVHALAHGDAQTSDPAPGARVRKVPARIAISFTEPPTKDSRFEVMDGCDQDVFQELVGSGTEVELRLADGQPGRWNVSYRVISATDGHLTRKSFGFKVAGSKDCSEPDPGETDDQIGTPPPQVASGDGEESSFPLGPVAIGGGAVVLIALVVRLLSAR